MVERAGRGAVRRPHAVPDAVTTTKTLFSKVTKDSARSEIVCVQNAASLRRDAESRLRKFDSAKNLIKMKAAQASVSLWISDMEQT